MKLTVVVVLTWGAMVEYAMGANTSPSSSSVNVSALDDLLNFVNVLSEGTFGRILAFSSALIGVGLAVYTQSLKGKVGALGAAMALAFMPQIISGVFASII